MIFIVCANIAIPPIPEVRWYGFRRCEWYVRFGPKADAYTNSLFNHLIGCCEQRGRHSKAECLGSLDVDHQIVLGGRLYRKIGRLFALENTIDVARSTPVLVDRIGAV